MNCFTKLRSALFAVICIAPMAFGDIVFYGTTRITVPVGTTVDVRNDARFRILARCDFDGDITHEIVYPANTVITASQEIKYFVENSRGESKEISVPVVFEGSAIKVERTVYTHSKSGIEAIQAAGTGSRRGDNHDVQHLGIFMPVNTTLKLRRLTDFSEGTIEIRAITGTYETSTATAERPVVSQVRQIGAAPLEWTPATNGNNQGRIPFFKTPLSDNVKSVVVELEISGGVKELDFYNYKDNNPAFYSRWGTSKNQYALFQNNAAVFIVPFSDRTNFGGTILNSNLDDLLEYYEDFTKQFNRFHGLDADSQNPNNKLIHTRYLIAPQMQGPGSAFYNEGWICGMSGSTLTLDTYTSYPKLISSDFWVSLHEFGHGYEGRQRQKEVNLTDVGNNLLGHFYQATVLDLNSASGRNRSWLFNYGRSSSDDLDKMSRDSRTGQLSDFQGYRERLYILVNMYNAESDKSSVLNAQKNYSAVWSLDRELSAKGIDLSFADLNAKGFGDATNTNIVPYMEAYGFGPHLSNLMRAYAFEEDNQIAYFVDLTAGSSAQSVAGGENLYGKTSGIQPKNSRNLNGTAQINIKIDDEGFELIEGKPLRIMNGGEVVFETALISKTVQIPSLPIGAYYVQLPSCDLEYYYVSGYNYLTVKNGEKTELTVEYKTLESSHVAGAMNFHFLGLGDRNVFRVKYDPIKEEIAFQLFSGQPHQSISNAGSPYVSMEFYSGSSRLYNRSVAGNESASASTTVLPAKIGDEIRFMHREATGRARAVNSFTSLQNTADYSFAANQTEILQITEYGIFKKGTSLEVQRNVFTSSFFAGLQEVKSTVSPQKWTSPDAYKDIKASFVLGANLLSEADRQRFESENSELFAITDPDDPDDPDNGTRISATNVRRAASFAITGITGAGRLNLSVPSAGNYTVSLYSVDGRQLAQTTANLASGANSLSFNRNLARGITIVRIQGANNAQFVKKMMVR